MEKEKIWGQCVWELGIGRRMRGNEWKKKKKKNGGSFGCSSE